MYQESLMGLEKRSLEELQAAADSTLEEVASRLHALLSELAVRLRPFPSFLGMASIQAIELELPMRPAVDRGCVVVCPDGEICELNLQAMPGIEGLSDMDQIEEFRELPLAAGEYIIYATTAIRMVIDELWRHG
jgi:hypothetical protein